MKRLFDLPKKHKITTHPVLLFCLYPLVHHKIEPSLVIIFILIICFLSSIKKTSIKKIKQHWLIIIIPLAISFFTFQQIAFLIDIHDKNIRPVKFIDYLFFISFFPQLIAGPIVFAKDMVPQINNLKSKIKKNNHFILGVFIFFVGFGTPKLFFGPNKCFCWPP